MKPHLHRLLAARRPLAPERNGLVQVAGADVAQGRGVVHGRGTQALSQGVTQCGPVLLGGVGGEQGEGLAPLAHRAGAHQRGPVLRARVQDGLDQMDSQ